MSDKKKKTLPRMVRKLGVRQEEVKTQLDEEELASERRVITDLMDKQDELKGELEEQKDKYKTLISGVDNEIQRTRKVIKSGFRREDVAVAEWLMSNNEVVRVREDTGEMVAPPRTARHDELQESLSLEPSTELAEGEVPPDEQSDEVAEDVAPEGEFPSFGDQ